VIAVRLLPEEYNPRLEVSVARVSMVLDKPKKLVRTQPSLSLFGGFPVFTSEGRPVGMIRLNQGGGGDAGKALSILSGAASIQPAAVFLDLLAHPPVKVEKGWLGIRMEPLRRDLAEIWNLPVEGGIIISDTVPGSPAESSGLRTEDIITAADGHPLRVDSYADLEWFRQEVRKKKPGETLHLQVIRGASSFGRQPLETKTINVTLGVSPSSEMEAETLALPEIGIKARSLTLDYLFANRLRPDMKGIVAGYVERAGPADIGKLKQDDLILSIDGHPMTDLGAARKAFEAFRKDKPKEIILHVLRGQSRLFIKINPDWD